MQVTKSATEQASQLSTEALILLILEAMGISDSQGVPMLPHEAAIVAATLMDDIRTSPLFGERVQESLDNLRYGWHSRP